ncbi:MAG: hypothetical protein NTV68_11915 [Methanomicrobiales archaeon]|nr:hypothetical protein [Methanomicrobiales archaeon]
MAARRSPARVPDRQPGMQVTWTTTTAYTFRSAANLGKGKSDTVNKILLQVPERFRLKGTMSKKALLFMDK